MFESKLSRTPDPKRSISIPIEAAKHSKLSMSMARMLSLPTMGMNNTRPTPEPQCL